MARESDGPQHIELGVTVPSPERRSSVAVVAVATVLVGLCALLWIVGTAPSGGPDEQWHIVRGAALVRGELDGTDLAGRGRYFEVPAWVGHPDPSCFRLKGDEPASCATDSPRPTGVAMLQSTADDYPVWGHVAAGLGTLLPAAVGNQAARVLDAAIPIGLIVAGLCLAARRGILAVAAASLAITPMAWFSVIVVNPSGLGIAGGFALWAGLLSAHRLMSGRPDRLVAWAIAAGWAAASLPRRDSAIWAGLIVAICAAAGVVDLRKLLTHLGTGPKLVVAASIVASTLWAVTSETSASKALALTPLLPIVGALVHAAWVRATNVAARVAIVGTVLGVTLAVGIGVLLTRPGGFERPILGRLVGQTGNNLEEAIGLLGWLDTPLPRLALFGWFVAFGVLAGAALMRGHRFAVGFAAAVLVTGIVVSWILELTRGESAGYYWQGRYYLPLLVAVPMTLGWSLRRPGAEMGSVEPDVDPVTEDAGDVATNERSVALAVLWTALAVLTLAFGASMRRWALGINGTILPWEWDTYGTLVPPMFLLVAHAVVCVALSLLVSRYVAPAPQERSRQCEPVVAHDG